MSLEIFREGSELGGGRYVLERRLGSGGMATVWVAMDTSLQRRVAIKLPSDALTSDPTFARRFEREARTAAAVSHPNLVPVYDYGTEGERPYLVSELIDGSSLDRLRDRGRAPSTESLAEGLLAALGHIHAAGIVHRDVKPGNVLVDGDRILLTDFGIAQPEDATSLTSAGLVIGTKRYIAPEVMRGERAGPSADLYALGVVLSEQLLDHDPDRVHRLVADLTAAEPRERPDTAELALEALEPVEPETATAPIAPPPPEPPEPEPERTLGPERVFADRERTAAAGRAPERERSAPTSRAPVPARRSGRTIAVGLLIAAFLGVVLVIALSGGDEEPPSGQQAAGRQDTSDETTSGETTTTTTTATETAETPAPAPESDSDAPSGDPVALNEQGKALLDSGDPAAAVPILEQAVNSYPEDSTELDYGYALFNYAQALRLSGDPEAAIPILQRRLQIPDQVSTVRAELKLARQEASSGG